MKKRMDGQLLCLGSWVSSFLDLRRVSFRRSLHNSCILNCIALREGVTFENFSPSPSAPGHTAPAKPGLFFQNGFSGGF